MDIESLIRRVQAGDWNAYEAVIVTYQQPLFVYCFMVLNSREEAEDIVQETFIRSYQKLHTYRINDSFHGWLYTIAGNLCRTQLRRRHRWYDFLRYSRRQQPEPAATGSWDCEPYLQMLTAEERQIVILHALEGFTLAELAQMMHKKPDAMRKQFERIRKKIKQSLERNGGGQHE